ncbi:MAG: M20/M25/M40 family metallo-hydrolase [Cyanothece sp. SIO1E1]|nr:M20/M25/M40 family metallo-hydrolase [Cyanothece sp. SIO1E1]
MTNLKERLYAHLVHLVRDRDPYLATAGHFYVQQYIREQLARWGQVEVHEFEVRGQQRQNLIVNLAGTKDNQGKTSPILIGAHYDAVPGSPGADDNATGVAVLLELARAFVKESARYPIRLVAFDMEEYGLLGSTQYAEELRRQGQSLRLMLSLEMLGYCDSTPGSQTYPPGLKYFYPNRGDFIGLIGNWSTIPDMLRLSRTIQAVGVPCQWLPAGQRGLIVPASRRSDHAPFWDQGYRALMVTDTAFLRNPYYHQVGDRLETLDLEFLVGVCQGLEQGIRDL